MPTLNDRIKFDQVCWLDAFDGQNKVYDLRGVVCPLSDWVTDCVRDIPEDNPRVDYRRETLLSMRVGEVRRIKLPADQYVPYYQLRLVSIE